MSTCNMCDGATFKAGYGDRLAPNGSLPMCSSCGSVERHRVVHAMYQSLRPLTRMWRALQFAPDGSLVPTDFKEFETSTFGGVNSLDMMRTGLPDGRYDLIASNHVLEHVQDQYLAIREMIRVVGPEGVVHACVPSPAQVVQSRDWGYADPARTYHFRLYGADAGVVFLGAIAEMHLICGVGRDAVTDTYELVYWMSTASQRLLQITAMLQQANFAVVGIR